MGMEDPNFWIYAAVWIAIVIVGLMIWWWPVTVAKQRRHPSIDAIRLLVILCLLCLPLPLWFVALIWAYNRPPPPPKSPQPPPRRPHAPDWPQINE